MPRRPLSLRLFVALIAMFTIAAFIAPCGAAPGRILDVRYEDLVVQPELQARSVQDYQGLRTVEDVTDILANKKVTTTASTLQLQLQLRQPIHTRNVGGWRRYAAGMAPVQALLADLVDDYETQDAAAPPLAPAG